MIYSTPDLNPSTKIRPNISLNLKHLVVATLIEEKTSGLQEIYSIPDLNPSTKMRPNTSLNPKRLVVATHFEEKTIVLQECCAPHDKSTKVSISVQLLLRLVYLTVDVREVERQGKVVHLVRPIKAFQRKGVDGCDPFSRKSVDVTTRRGRIRDKRDFGET